MIDWLKFVAPLRRTFNNPPPNGGTTIRTDEHGAVLYEYCNPLRVVGSHDSTIGVRARGDGYMVVDGNPSKLLQGHNVFGPECLQELALRTAVLAAEALGVTPTADDWQDWLSGNLTIKTVDCTYSLRLKSRAQCLALLKQMETTATMQYRGRGQLTKGSTLYFGKNSRRSAIKFYSKGEEINAPNHRLHPALLSTDMGAFLLKFADPLLRSEVRLHAKELVDRGLSLASNWDRSTPRRIHNEFWSKINMSDQITADDSIIEKLPNRLKSVAKHHLRGEDTRNLYSRSVWYRHRKALLEHGIDLAANNGNRANAKPLKVVKPETVVLSFDYNNQVPDVVRGTPYDPEQYQSSGLGREYLQAHEMVPHDIALKYPDQFPDVLEYWKFVEQHDLFH